jgi:hypothetical protein
MSQAPYDTATAGFDSLRSLFHELNPGADAILRTSDDIDFYVHRLLLSLASPVFRTMFAADYRATSSSPHPTYLIAENSNTLHLLLKWCDPRCTPIMDVVLEVAYKYDMDGIMKHVGEVLKMQHHIIESQPVRVFAIAMRYKLEDVTRIAAKETLQIPPGERTNPPELKYITAPNLQHLYRYYFICRSAAMAVTTSFSWMTDKNYSWLNSSCQCQRVLVGGFNCTRWVLTFVDLVREALSNKPRGETVTRSLFGEPIKQAATCGICRPLAYTELEKFSAVIALETERRIATITLTIED